MSFSLRPPTAKALPVIVEVPHAGLSIPVELASELASHEPSRKRDADLYVDRLCHGIEAEGATFVVAHLSRHVVDLNRGPDDVDPLLSRPEFDRRGAPRGVVWRTGTDSRALLKRALTPAEIAARIERYYTPYHEQLDQQVEALRAAFGRVLVLSVHSMPSMGRRADGERPTRRADVVPGTRGGTTVGRPLLDHVDRHFRDAGFSVRHDEPYRGGHTTGRLGRPEVGVHAVQLELSRALYMDETTLEPRAAEVQRLAHSLRTLVASLGRLLLETGDGGGSGGR